jgi:hypothetical protein
VIMNNDQSAWFQAELFIMRAFTLLHELKADPAMQSTLLDLAGQLAERRDIQGAVNVN